MSGRYEPDSWDRWQSSYLQQLLDDGLPVKVALPFARIVAVARRRAASIYGHRQAEEAVLELEFHADGNMTGRLVGKLPDWYRPQKNAAAEAAASSSDQGQSRSDYSVADSTSSSQA